jgi:hypothetical protein
MTETRNALDMEVPVDLNFVGGDVFRVGPQHRSWSGPRSTSCQRGTI